MAEVMVTIAILGVLAAVMIPTVTKLAPNSRKLMFKKAYSSTETVISELINDESLYAKDPDFTGFANTSAVTVAGVAYSGATKFCNLFAEKLNVMGAVDCNTAKTLAVAAVPGSGPNFTTNDGVAWYVDTNAFTLDTPGETATINIDINGNTGYSINGNPNCVYVSAAVCPEPDQFTITIRNDGKITVAGVKESEYLQNFSVQK